MQYRCSACHHAFEADASPGECPRCHVEAGLERHHAPAPPMKLFGLLLGAVLVASAVGGVLGFVMGHERGATPSSR
ncbi:MAG: hypothetical protein IPH07_01585 [Deltaproteobacteria bacterium]|nr:hypothetical protein [Deltaproteobacteria bacterium]MBK8238301.1 hypothetical protein [Deltaproteobacteria bacterium]MBK8720166.1 hypothetical protein [Deltaproteobacteria bacterium]MBP7286014.1 hypothetical protein [Nannocystaceae bacterium]